MPTPHKHLILWLKPGDPPSERAKVLARTWSQVIASDIPFKIVTVNEMLPEVTRVPCLHFCMGSQIVYALEGDITMERVLGVFRKLG